jgi:hypothetical protein
MNRVPNTDARPNVIGAEIGNLEHELADLRSRYANLERHARWVRPSYFTTLALVAGFLVLGIALDKMLAVAVSSFFLILLIAAGITSSDRRMIDVVSYDYFGYPHRSYAGFLEQAIAEREARLASLRNDQ